MKYKNISEAFTDAMQNEQSYDKKLDPILENVFYKSNKFSKVGWYVEKTDNPEIFKVIERWERKAEISNL